MVIPVSLNKFLKLIKYLNTALKFASSITTLWKFMLETALWYSRWTHHLGCQLPIGCLATLFPNQLHANSLGKAMKEGPCLFPVPSSPRVNSWMQDIAPSLSFSLSPFLSANSSKNLLWNEMITLGDDCHFQPVFIFQQDCVLPTSYLMKLTVK